MVDIWRVLLFFVVTLWGCLMIPVFALADPVVIDFCFCRLFLFPFSVPFYSVHWVFLVLVLFFLPLPATFFAFLFPELFWVFSRCRFATWVDCSTLSFFSSFLVAIFQCWRWDWMIALLLALSCFWVVSFCSVFRWFRFWVAGDRRFLVTSDCLSGLTALK